MSHFRVHMKLEIREYDDRAAIVSGSEVACLGSCLGPMTRNHAEVFADEVLSQFKRLEAENPAAQEAEFAIMHAHLAGGFEPPPPGAMKPGSEWARQIPIPSDAIFSGDAWGDAMKNLLRGK